MSGFDARWLDLREPADHAARDPALLDAARAYLLAGGEAPLAVDLGSGTGSTLRAFGPATYRVRWRLVDNDPRLLAAAGARLGSFRSVEGVEADLAALPSAVLDGARLVTASALFDLASRRFVLDLAERLARRRTALYAALSYDGRMSWDPHRLEDESLVAAFNAHQTGDKGFGAALGPGAASALAEAFEAQGYAVRAASSPWRLGADDAPLLHELTEGFVQAVAETGRVDPRSLARWRTARRAGSDAACEVGHWDVLALPPPA